MSSVSDVRQTSVFWRGGVKRVELYQKVRLAVLIDGLSRCGAARYFGINRKTIDKMLCFPEPEAHGRSGQTYSRKLAGFTVTNDQILMDDRKVHTKQRHQETTLGHPHLRVCAISTASTAVLPLSAIM